MQGVNVKQQRPPSIHPSIHSSRLLGILGKSDVFWSLYMDREHVRERRAKKKQQALEGRLGTLRRWCFCGGYITVVLFFDLVVGYFFSGSHSIISGILLRVGTWHTTLPQRLYTCKGLSLPNWHMHLK